MNKFFKMVAVAAAGIAIALLAPASTWAACPGSVIITQCLTLGGGAQADPLNTGVGGTFWIPGQGLDAIGPGDTSGGFGNDAGQLAGFPIPVDGSSWLTDFGLGSGGTGDLPGFVCFVWDWVSSGSDGCAVPGSVMAAVLRDSSGGVALMSVGDSGTASGSFYDFDTITNGGTSPQGNVGNGVLLTKALTVASSADLGGTVSVTVAPLNLISYDDQGGVRPIPGTPRLRGTVGAVSSVVSNGPGGGSVNVDADTDLCWEIVDGGYSATLGCIRVGGGTPSQNVTNGKASFAKGGANFSWDVTAQFDVLGFNIYQKNSKGTDRKVNDGLIPVSGDNDATAEAYNYLAPRSDLRAWKGGFEIELVRQNGETSRAPVSIVR